jgi:hypothetical protein
MAHQNLLFDNYVDMDRAQASPYTLNNIAAYDVYSATGSQYANVAASSFNTAWDHHGEYLC